MPDWRKPFAEIEIGKGRKISDGEDMAILSIGHPGNFVIEAKKQLITDGIIPAHYDLRFVKPIDTAMLHEVFTRFDKVITVEDGCLEGGMGSAVLEFMADNNYHVNITRLGIPDMVIEHGEQPELWAECGYDAKSIAVAVKAMAGKRNAHTIAS